MTTTNQPSRFQCAVARGARAALLVAGVAALAGCSTSTFDHLPVAVGGLPENVPPRPAVESKFPAVHDMPPARQDTVLTDAEKHKLREDLARQRESAARETEAAISADPTGTIAAPARTP